MKILNPRIHGFIDYAVVLLFALAPTLLGFGGVPRTICYVIAAAQLMMTLFTAYPMGLVKVIPFTLHGGVEAATAVLLAALPWVFGFAHVMNARNFFLGSAGALALTWLLTNYRAADYPYHHGPRRPSHGLT